MKKIIFVMGILFMGGATMAQSGAVRQSVKILADQVPLSVRQTFEKEFAALPQDGYWVAFIESSADGQRTATKPLWYSYNSKKGKSGKIEIRFTPIGEVTSVKGAEHPNHNASDQTATDRTG